MQLNHYVASEKKFSVGNLKFEVMKIYGESQFPSDRMVCYNTTESDDDGKNGVRIPYGESNVLPGFHAFLSENDILNIAKTLAEESKTNNIRFVLDDEMTESEGLRALRFYKMSVLRSEVVA